MLCASPPFPKNSLAPPIFWLLLNLFSLKLLPWRTCIEENAIWKILQSTAILWQSHLLKIAIKVTTPSPRFVKDSSSCHRQSKSETDTSLITFCQIYYFQLCGHFQPSTSCICFSLSELDCPFCQMWLKYSRHLLHQVSTAEESWLINQFITVVSKSEICTRSVPTTQTYLLICVSNIVCRNKNTCVCIMALMEKANTA